MLDQVLMNVKTDPVFYEASDLYYSAWPCQPFRLCPAGAMKLRKQAWQH